MKRSASGEGAYLPPSTSLPPIRQIPSSSENQITFALKNLQALYCPLRLPSTISTPVLKRRDILPASTPILVDSGYASQDEDGDLDDEDDLAACEEVISSLRADPFERTFASRWLTSLLARVEEMPFSTETKYRIADDAAFILSSFCDTSSNDDDQALTRDFNFATKSGKEISVVLNDEPLSGTDHTDVGLQSWGASVILSSMICADPARFGLTQSNETLVQRRHILELGAGTGLVSLTLAKLIGEELEMESSMPTTISTTDYHPAVLSNCTENIKTNFPSLSPHSQTSPETLILDWTCPPAHLRSSVDLLFASDVIYAAEHAVWLRGCAAHLLARNGIFWLLATLRTNGKFETIGQTVEAAFAGQGERSLDKCQRLRILEKQNVEKKRGIGRGDEVGYVLYKIGWGRD